MALGTNPLTTYTQATFIPELWSDEIAAKQKSNLVLANLVINMDHTGKYGDTVHVPSPSRSAASQFTLSSGGGDGSEGQVITPTRTTPSEFTIAINQWWYNSKQIPDIVVKQALPSMRRFYTDDLSYSLAVAVDSYLHGTIAPNLRKTSTNRDGFVSGADGSTTWNPSANTNTGNGGDLTDEGIRRVMQTLDDIDVPGTDRFWVVPPVTKRKLLGIPRYTEQAFVGDGGAIRTGYVGNLYGTPVYVSSNCSSFLATDASTAYRSCIYAHKDSMILIEQMKPRVQSQYKLEYLSDVLVADVLFGGAVVRTENDKLLDRGVGVVVPAA
jgi:hypothetical protein